MTQAAQEQEILIRNLDDPTQMYSVKDKATFERVYGANSRFIIASGPDMDDGLKAYYAAITPNLPAEEAGVEVGSPEAPVEAPTEAPVEAPADGGSPEF